MNIEENQRTKNKRFRSIINIFISVILLILLVYLSLRGLDLSTLGKYIISANYWWVLLSVPVGLLSHWARALRWRTMLKPISNPNSVWNLFSAVMAGYAVNNIIPRGGELLRPYYYSRREKISFTMTFASIVVERFIDLISLLMVFVLAYFFFRQQLKAAIPNLHIENIIYPTIFIIIIGILSFYKKWVDFLLVHLVKPVSKKVYQKLSELFKKFFLG
ncbi:MAG: lysylphosphatidylglycerol synthase transmembrane domain-containing protein, partial [Candidatus Kapaibacteriota bacterium]